MFTHKVERITPEMAKKYYAKSKGNRVIRRKTVNEYIAQMRKGLSLGILPAYKQARMALTVASGSKAIMQIVYSAWYAYEHNNITEDFVMIEGSFV